MQTMQIAYAVDAELDQMKFKLKIFAIHSFFLGVESQRAAAQMTGY